MSGKHLDFLVIGAQKCATSWLYYCLKDHPDLHLPAKKREVEYLGGDLYWSRGAEWYFSLFDGARDGQKLGAVSVQYLFDARSPKEVRLHAPDAKLIVSLRDPVERAVSAYNWYSRRGRIPLRGAEDGLSLALDPGFPMDPEERGYLNDVLERGFYDLQMDRYLDHFQPRQMMVVLFEEIEKDPLGVLRKIYAFIGVNPSFRPGSLKTKPKHTTSFRPLIRLEQILPKTPATGKLLDFSSQFLYRLGVGKNRSEISKSLAEKLEALYRPHVAQTRRLLLKLPPEQRPRQDIMKAQHRR